ncbi:hypothetical protein [Haematobacter sp.]|uniref:hypothetical protein n=1 Tax=Haematobacter sp. TaxID=2953762 RepID=UPI0028A7EC5C|nr:hypothetical protein [Haematobacter sp.]
MFDDLKESGQEILAIILRGIPSRVEEISLSQRMGDAESTTTIKLLPIKAEAAE